MHPILKARRLGLYLLAWTPLAALLAYFLTRVNSISTAEAVALTVPLAFIYALLCLSAWFLCRATPIAISGFLRIFTTHLTTAIVLTGLWMIVAEVLAIMLSFLGFEGLEHRLALPPLFAVGVLLYLLSVAFHYVLLAMEASREAEKREMEALVLARDAELRALKAQVNPHFLFNSLNSISALTTVDAARAREMCVTLADFLRRTLGLGDKSLVPLEEELALVRRFLAVEKVRFGARLEMQENIAPDALACMVPPLLLQPLVENAVWHGIANLPEGGSVRLNAGCDDAGLSIVIENSFDPDTEPTRRNGVGLQNVRQRLEARYGMGAALNATPDGNCFRVAVRLPVEREPA